MAIKKKVSTKTADKSTEEQSNTINYPPSSTRYSAFFYDFLVVLGLFVLLSQLFEVTAETARNRLITFLALAFLYEPVCNAFGCTVGQLITNIRVRRYETPSKKIPLHSAIIRLIFKLGLGILAFFYLGTIKNRRAIHDRIAGSIVVEGNYPKIKNLIQHQVFKFVFVALCYILWVIWLGNFWWLLGVPVIFDMYITKKVNWTFWKKRNVKKRSAVVEWVDALIFAVIAATFIRMFFIEAFTIPTSSMEKTLMVGDYLFVSKFHYGPRVPMTPLSFPFVHHTLPLTDHSPSYLTWIQNSYRRMNGLTDIKRDDIVVFNFPAGDTVINEFQSTQTYYQVIRSHALELMAQDRATDNPEEKIKPFKEYYAQARKSVWHNYDITIRPIDKRENYIKRCVALPGDTLQIIQGDIFVNSKKQKHYPGKQYKYIVVTNRPIQDEFQRTLNISNEDLHAFINKPPGEQKQYKAYVQQQMPMGYHLKKLYVIPLTSKSKKILNNTSFVDTILSMPSYNLPIVFFPNSMNFNTWDENNYGPIVMPSKGTTVSLTLENIPLYKRVIDKYEDNDLEIKDSVIHINGVPATEYTFKMDYYWLMGDSRHNSQDSRFWGYVPEDHIVGKPLFIWLSLDPDKKGFFNRIRWDRMFTIIHKYAD